LILALFGMPTRIAEANCRANRSNIPEPDGLCARHNTGGQRLFPANASGCITGSYPEFCGIFDRPATGMYSSKSK
jgi:hypothetical protein